MDRASKSISLVLISSALVFAGWASGEHLRQTHPEGHAGGPYPHGYSGPGRFFWFHSVPSYYPYPYGGGPWRGGTAGGTGVRPGRPGIPGQAGGARAPSVRGGFGSFGRGVGA